jgi:hypothetical protein
MAMTILRTILVAFLSLPASLVRTRRVLIFGLFTAAMIVAQVPKESLQVTNAAGLRLNVDEENDLAALRILLPTQQNSDRGIWVLFPEHVTALERGKTESQQLYLFRPGRQASRIDWRRMDRSVEYAAEFQPGIHMVARATIEDDGVRYRYEFTNASPFDYDMIQAVTDPRMVSPYFRDVRLERTYVHHTNGFDLLASETPNRLDIPLSQWLPNRYRVPYTWPTDPLRIAKQPDGITWYNKSRAVDEPFIATRSIDDEWTMATFSYDPGNVWVNPELTCQHADPQVSLHRGESRSYELKTLVIQGPLETALAKVKQQRLTLEH